MAKVDHTQLMMHRFRGFLPVVVDVETAGFNSEKDALLEIAAVTVMFDESGCLQKAETYASHVQPFPGANLDKSSLEFTGIDPHHPFRLAVSELEALKNVFNPIRQAVKSSGCSRAILVGHNPAFDLSFLKAAVNRAGIKHNPFHQFSTFDTATLAGLAFGQTVLARAIKAADIDWDSDSAHSARYDAEKTAELFCKIINMWGEFFPNPALHNPASTATQKTQQPAKAEGIA
ncbi:MAG: ribonuclease T [Gammaproteobacteria bacterium]|nr:ribonuclease T [Gammaproteobacteria bacterium]